MTHELSFPQRTLFKPILAEANKVFTFFGKHFSFEKHIVYKSSERKSLNFLAEKLKNFTRWPFEPLIAVSQYKNR